MNALIIEDEPFSAEELKRLIKKVDFEIYILNVLDSVKSAVDWLTNNPAPDLIFMDVQLADGLSFEIIQKVEISCPVIFTTAYDEYALRAFKFNSIDYLLKPVEEEALSTALRKFKQLRNQFRKPFNSSQLEEIRQLIKPKYKQRFVSRIGDQIRYIPVEKVAYFHAEDKHVYLTMIEGKRLIVDHKLEYISDVLDPLQFFRLNRKYIVSINSIRSVSKFFNSRLKISLSPDSEEKILVSRERASAFKLWLEGE